MVWPILSAILAVVCIALLLRLRGIRQSLREITEGLHRRLHEDTNAAITVSSADPGVRGIAAALNRELAELRHEQLRLKNGSHELQSAVTNIAHDLRTPLTAISGYLELLEQMPQEEKTAGYLAVIRERTEVLRSLTEELFRYSVVDDSADRLQPEALSLKKELEIALAGAYQMLTERGITPDIDLPEDPVARTLDRKALQRIFSNILVNAARYSAGDLTVSLDTDGTVLFANTAPSLSEIEVGRLFDRFYTVNNAKGSTGLGLSIARLLTEKLGGRIDASYDRGRLFIRLRF